MCNNHGLLEIDIVESKAILTPVHLKWLLLRTIN